MSVKAGTWLSDTTDNTRKVRDVVFLNALQITFVHQRTRCQTYSVLGGAK